MVVIVDTIHFVLVAQAIIIIRRSLFVFFELPTSQH